MIAFLIEAEGGAAVLARTVGSRGEGAEVEQQGPASQSSFAGALLTGEAAVSVQNSVPPVGQAVDQMAGATASGVAGGADVFGFLVPQFGQNLAHGGGPGLRFGPFAQRGHPLLEFGGGGRAVDLPDTLMQGERCA